MSVRRCLSVVEGISRTLDHRTKYCEKVSVDAASAGCIYLYFLGLVALVASVAHGIVEKLAVLLSSLIAIEDSVRGYRSVCTIKSQQAVHYGEAQVSFKSAPGKFEIYLLREGETFISSESARLSPINSCHSYIIPHTQSIPPVTIRIRINAGKILSSKLIYSSAGSKGGNLRISRRFGLDELPIRLNENINIATDRIYIGDEISINFKNHDVLPRTW